MDSAHHPKEHLNPDDIVEWAEFLKPIFSRHMNNLVQQYGTGARNLFFDRAENLSKQNLLLDLADVQSPTSTLDRGTISWESTEAAMVFAESIHRQDDRKFSSKLFRRG